MPMSTELILVDGTIISLIVAEAIAPNLRAIESELAKTLHISVHQWTPSERRDAQPLGRSDAKHDGVARILCRRNHGGDRLIVRARLLFGPEPETGYSGFDSRGWVDLAGPWFVPRGYTNLYHQLELPTQVT
jgi:hypothetical protein